MRWIRNDKQDSESIITIHEHALASREQASRRPSSFCCLSVLVRFSAHSPRHRKYARPYATAYLRGGSSSGDYISVGDLLSGAGDGAIGESGLMSPQSMTGGLGPPVLSREEYIESLIAIHKHALAS